MFVMPQSKWIVVSNCRIPEIETQAVHHGVGEFHIYHRGLAGRIPMIPPFEFDVRQLTVEPENHHLPSSHLATRIRVDEDSIVVMTSLLNEDPVYAAVHRTAHRLAYFTDLFLAPLVLPALGLPAELREGPLGDEETTLVNDVRRLSYGKVQETRRTRRGWVWRSVQGNDALIDRRPPRRHNAMTAGKAQLVALAQEIDRIARERPEARYATLLSGGIDSGTVTYLTAARGLPVTPYTVGTPWGDEFDDAGELCDFLGLELATVRLEEEDIIASIPDAVRWLAVTSAEVVEVALTATAVYRLGIVDDRRVLLTGYGSDLINAGLYTPHTDPAELIDQVITGIHLTRFTNELSNRMPLAFGMQTFHPFWTWPVMRVALDTAPECKVRDGREKYHLRVAMNTHVPHPIAWRRKIAVHHGGGLQDGVTRRLERDTGQRDRELFYRSCFAELLALASKGELEPTDPRSLYECAVSRMRSRRTGPAERRSPSAAPSSSE
jgi:asparagine synthetase B (glutamine-hydrolysing)